MPRLHMNPSYSSAFLYLPVVMVILTQPFKYPATGVCFNIKAFVRCLFSFALPTKSTEHAYIHSTLPILTNVVWLGK